MKLTWVLVGAGPRFCGPKAEGPPRPSRYCYNWVAHRSALRRWTSREVESGWSGPGEERVRTKLPQRTSASVSKTISWPWLRNRRRRRAFAWFVIIEILRSVECSDPAMRNSRAKRNCFDFGIKLADEKVLNETFFSWKLRNPVNVRAATKL